MQRASVRLTNPQGLHARPAAMFTMTASGFPCDIQVEKAGKTVNGKSVIKLLSLDCRTGDQITITADGIDDVVAVQKLVGLIESGLGEKH
jgi:phosphotransferase system HPr (HPr) family protein